MLGGYLDNRIETELEELRRRRLRTFVVGLIYCDQHRPVRLAQLLRDALVARDEPFASIDHQNQEIGSAQGPLSLADHQLVQRILAMAEHPAGIE
jgi:hypothetical protein